MNEEPKVTLQEIKIKGSQLVEKVKELIEEGNARKVIIKKDDQVYLEVPLTWGVGGAVAALWVSPLLAAVGALAALVSDVTIVIERVEEHAEVVETRPLRPRTEEGTPSKDVSSSDQDESPSKDAG